jgi:hypothetical protein
VTGPPSRCPPPAARPADAWRAFCVSLGIVGPPGL